MNFKTQTLSLTHTHTVSPCLILYGPFLYSEQKFSQKVNKLNAAFGSGFVFQTIRIGRRGWSGGEEESTLLRQNLAPDSLNYSLFNSRCSDKQKQKVQAQCSCLDKI